MNNSSLKIAATVIALNLLSLVAIFALIWFSFKDQKNAGFYTFLFPFAAAPLVITALK